MEIVIIIATLFAIFALYIFCKIQDEMPPAPKDGDVYKYDEEKNEFSVSHLENGKRITKTYKRK